MSSMEHNSSEKKRRALRIAISILVAVTLWLYVDYQKHPKMCIRDRKKSTHSVTTIPSGSSVIIQSIWPLVCFLFIPYFLP